MWAQAGSSYSHTQTARNSADVSGYFGVYDPGPLAHELGSRFLEHYHVRPHVQCWQLIQDDRVTYMYIYVFLFRSVCMCMPMRTIMCTYHSVCVYVCMGMSVSM